MIKSIAFNRSWILGALLVSVLTSSSWAAELKLANGDHICLVGNGLGERLQHQNDWEALLHQRFPDLELVVRNLCHPGDEPLNRLRTLNFGDPHKHLAHSKASVVLFFFGFNESFAGEQGLNKFIADLGQVIEDTKKQNYNGNAAPRMAIISPIAFENTGDASLPDGVEHNNRLAAYTAAMKKLADEHGVAFADVFTPTKALFAKSDVRHTLNGAHLNASGYSAFAPVLDAALFGNSANTSLNQKVKAEIDDKNFHWWHRYRAVNGYSIWGTRGSAGFDGTYRNRDVMERERAVLDQMCANRDARIWALAQGKTVANKADDSNTLPFIQTKTNVDPAELKKNSKLGSLDYLSGEEQQKTFKLPPGYEINLFASEEDFPELANPVSMNFDSQGRCWVSVMPSYPQWQPKSKLNDKLLILEDKDNDGKADECKVFADGLHQPTGFEIGKGGAYVAQQPDILFLKDTDGDDQADERRRDLVGFCTADSHHGLSAFEWGPGGGLYFAEGTFKQSQVESAYGLTRLGDAGVWRHHPVSHRFEAHISIALANPWGHVFDRWGQNFIADASPGHNFWATPISGAVNHPDKHPGGGRAKNLDFGGSKVKKDYPTFIVKRTRPSSGCEIVSSRNFPPEAQGNFLLNNVIGDRSILQHKVREEKSGFVGVEVEPLVVGGDGNFRPVDLQFGPDGALYIVDWHNALIGHLQHNLRDPSRDHSHGRIWRVTYSKRPLVKPPVIADAPLEDLLELLKEPEDRTRYRVRRELGQRDPAKVIAATKKWIAGLDESDKQFEHHRLEGLWIHQTHNSVDLDLLKKVLNSTDYRARAAATRVLSYWRHQVDETVALLKFRINDKHPRVRLEAVRACSFLPAGDVQEMVLDVLNH
ncbi:MAG: putative membrane-bound dehydrogenase-like protein, partial [Pirellulaceae bacterium]